MRSLRTKSAITLLLAHTLSICSGRALLGDHVNGSKDLPPRGSALGDRETERTGDYRDFEIYGSKKVRTRNLIEDPEDESTCQSQTASDSGIPACILRNEPLSSRAPCTVFSRQVYELNKASKYHFYVYRTSTDSAQPDYLLIRARSTSSPTGFSWVPYDDEKYDLGINLKTQRYTAEAGPLAGPNGESWLFYYHEDKKWMGRLMSVNGYPSLGPRFVPSEGTTIVQGSKWSMDAQWLLLEADIVAKPLSQVRDDFARMAWKVDNQQALSTEGIQQVRDKIKDWYDFRTTPDQRIKDGESESSYGLIKRLRPAVLNLDASRWTLMKTFSATSNSQENRKAWVDYPTAVTKVMVSSSRSEISVIVERVFATNDMNRYMVTSYDRASDRKVVSANPQAGSRAAKVYQLLLAQVQYEATRVQKENGGRPNLPGTHFGKAWTWTIQNHVINPESKRSILLAMKSIIDRDTTRTLNIDSCIEISRYSSCPYVRQAFADLMPTDNVRPINEIRYEWPAKFPSNWVIDKLVVQADTDPLGDDNAHYAGIAIHFGPKQSNDPGLPGMGLYPPPPPPLGPPPG
ncbi:MAG: hypothetical protein Q9227_003776 [Pyrenula ochraceoflavens]